GPAQRARHPHAAGPAARGAVARLRGRTPLRRDDARDAAARDRERSRVGGGRAARLRGAQRVPHLLRPRSGLRGLREPRRGGAPLAPAAPAARRGGAAQRRGGVPEAHRAQAGRRHRRARRRPGGRGSAAMRSPGELDHYELLDVSRDASREEIERAFKLARATWEDGGLATYSLYGEREIESLRERVEHAFGVLADPDARAAYDRSLAGR